MKRLMLILPVAILIVTNALAVEPEEMLSDPVLEARAQALDEQIRCVQCQSENIASSNAGWARDARTMLRTLIADGATDAEVLDYFVERYDERVLMNPRVDGANILLWISGPAILLLSLLGFFLYHRQSKRPGSVKLSAREQARLDELLDDAEGNEQ